MLSSLTPPLDPGRVDRVAPSSRGRRRRPSRRLAILATGAALTLAACAPGADSDGEAGSGSSAGAAGDGGGVSTEVPTEGEISLTMAHFENSGLAESIDTLIAQYEELHPNVTIETQPSSFADYSRSIRLTMSSDDPPDIAQVGQAYVMQGPLVSAGLLLPLDDYAEAYGWEDRFQEGLLAQSRFEPDGEPSGTGPLYGLALGGNMVGVYYNVGKLEQLGIDPAGIETLADFEAALTTAKAAGETPIQLGNLEAWPANHTLSSLTSQLQPTEDQLDWIFGRDGASFDNPGVEQALTTMQRWAQEGLIDEAANGTAFDDGVAKFTGGDGVFLITGNWALQTVADGLGDNAGFMLFPPVESGGPLRATGATTSPFAISATTEHADVAANFLDFMTSDEAVPVLLEGGYAPVAPGAAGSTEDDGTLQSTFRQAFSDVLADDGLTLYMDWSTTTMGDTLFPALQQLIGGQSQPRDVIDTVQQDWDAARGS